MKKAQDSALMKERTLDNRAQSDVMTAITGMIVLSSSLVYSFSYDRLMTPDRTLAQRASDLCTAQG